MTNQDLTLTVNPGEMTLDEFDRAVRGFRAKLQAYGDVFKMTDRVPVVTPIVYRTPKVLHGKPGFNDHGWWLAFNVSKVRSGTELILAEPSRGISSKPFIYDRKVHAPSIITVSMTENTKVMPGCKYSHLFGV